MRSSVKCAVPPVRRSSAWNIVAIVGVLASSCVLASSGVLASTNDLASTSSSPPTSLLLGNSPEGSGLVTEVGRALDRLAALPKPFSLVPGVRIEKREAERPTDAAAVAAARHVTLVDSADRVFRGHDLVLDTAPGLQMRVTAVGDGRGFKVLAEPSSRSEPRTFGVMRRLKLALLPIMYKLGVITTLLTLLTVFALKGLTIGVLLLIMGSVGLIHKFKAPYYHEGGHAPQKDVHVHVHGGGGGHSYPVYHSGESYWDRSQPPAAGQPPFWDRQQPAGGQPPWGPPADGQFRYPHQMDINKRNPWEQFIS